MKRYALTISLLLLSAVVASAFPAQSVAVQTAKVCTPVKGLAVEYSDAHCLNSVANPNFETQGFRLVEPAETAISLTNVTTGAEKSTVKLKSIQSGVTLELQATEVEGNGWLKNEGGFGVEGFLYLVLRKVTVTAPAGKGCSVSSVPVTSVEKTTTGLIHTRELKILNFALTPNQIKIAGSLVAEPLAEFNVFGCSVSALNHRYALTGNVIGNTSGATVNFTHAGTTEQNRLFLFEQKAGLEGSLTIKDSSGNGVVFN